MPPDNLPYPSDNNAGLVLIAREAPDKGIRGSKFVPDASTDDAIRAAAQNFADDTGYPVRGYVEGNEVIAVLPAPPRASQNA